MNQLLNKQNDKIFPITHFTQVFDTETNRSLQDVITQVNSYFIPFYKNSEETRASIPMYLRRKGLQITYLDQKNKVQTEIYNSNKYEDEFFIQDKRWIRSNTVIGTKLAISAEGNWLIDGVDTGISIYPSDMDWEFINNKPTRLSQFQNDVPFAKQKHTHTIPQVEYLQEIIESLQLDIDSLQVDIDSLQGTASGNDERYASKEIQKAVQNIQDSNGNSLYNKEGIVIPANNPNSFSSGDLILTPSGFIDSIIDHEDNTYTLLLSKYSTNPNTDFRVNDILRGGKYPNYSFSRVLAIDEYKHSITIVYYKDNEVPYKSNYRLNINDTFNVFGNINNKDRQSVSYLSSNEGRIVFLTGVTKPILEDYNYASFWGKPIPLKIFEGKPINMDHPYAYMRGLLVQDLIRVDYNGVPIKTIVNKGPWKKGEVYNDGSKPPYIQHDVYHNGVIWRCVVDNATEEPKFNSSQWSVMSNNTRFGLELFTDAPLFYRANTSFNYAIEAKVFHGKEEITDKIRDIDWRWYRTTGDIPADNRWNVLHENSRNIVSLTEDDLGDPQSGITTFKCEVFIRDGEIDYKISKKIIL